MSDLRTPHRPDDAVPILLPADQHGRHIRKARRRLPRVSAEQAELGRLLGRGLAMRLPALDAELTAGPAGADAAGQLDWPGAVILDGPAGALQIEEGARWLRVLTGIDPDALRAEDGLYPDWARSALLGRLADTPFAQCRSLSPGLAAAGPDLAPLAFELRTASHVVGVRMRASPAAWRGILSQPGWRRLRTPQEPWLALRTRGTVRLGSHALPARALRALVAGDILLPDDARFNCAGEGWLACGGCRIEVRYAGRGRLAVTGVAWGAADEPEDEPGDWSAPFRQPTPNDGEKNMDDQDDVYPDAPDVHPDDVAAAAESPELDAVRIPMHFELGSVQLSLGELRGLSPGAILPLTGGSPEAVAITSGGRRLGRGELVEVDGRLGIRVTAWEMQGE